MRNNTNNRHSNELDDIISAPPGWLLKWGISIFLALFILLLVLSYTIKYPDIIKLNFVIKEKNTPPYLSNLTGQLVLFAKNDEVVKKGRLLAIIRNGYEIQKLVAMQNGRIMLQASLKNGSTVKSGMKLLTITSDDDGYFGVVAIPQKLVTRFAKGQKVILKTDSYPYQKYGVVKGVVDTIALPTDGTVFVATIHLTVKNKKIHLKKGLTGEADIIIQDIPLLRKIINDIKESFTQKYTM